MAAVRRSDESISESDNTGKVVRRRGILAVAGAALAGLAAKAAREATPVGAADGDTVRVGTHVTGTLTTELTTTNDSTPPYGMWFVRNTGQADAIVGQNGGGGTAGTAGVRGEILSGSNGSGVVGSFGLNDVTGPSAVGGNGVYGYAATGGNNGVLGIGPSSSQGVQGICNGPSALSYGVLGTSDNGYGGAFFGGGFAGLYGSGSTGHGVYGIANAAGTSQITAGVFGDSTTTYGLIGRTTAPGYSGLTGTTGVAALAATSTNANAYAAYFTGKTVVEGDFYVVRHGDGTGGGSSRR